MTGLDWELVWRFVWPILRQGLIALLMALLTLLGYDKYVPSRFARNGGEDELQRRVAASLMSGERALSGRKGAGHER
jgi:hypothetical protein